MANEEHLHILKQGVEAWNTWRENNPVTEPDFINANLSGAKLAGANFDRATFISANLERAELTRATFRKSKLSRVKFGRANLNRAVIGFAELTFAKLIGANLEYATVAYCDLSGATLTGANLKRANLDGTNLRRAKLERANFENANLTWADLRNTELRGANFRSASLSNANFESAVLEDADFHDATITLTILSGVDLSKVKGLGDCYHIGPSIVDHRTLERSRDVPISFWRGCGLPDALVDYMPSLTGNAIQFYSCFISYSSKDQEFAARLHADLQDKGVRCWFAPHDLPIGAKIWDGLDEAIRLRDKVVLILSEDAIDSDWVEDEVATALEEERRRKEIMLFPIRLDGAVMETGEAWASKLRARHIGDFTRWKDHDAYKAKFERVLRDLRRER